MEQVGRGMCAEENKFNSDNEEETINRQENYRRSRCLIHNNSSHRTEECREYIAMDPTEKVNLVKEKRGCWACVIQGHRSYDCRRRVKCPEDYCDKYHRISLHAAHDMGVIFHSSCEVSSSVLLQLMKVPTGTSQSKELNVLWDSGANISLITFRMATELKLKGEMIKLSVTKVGGSEEVKDSQRFVLPLKDEDGSIIELKMYGIVKISNEIKSLSINNVIHLFRKYISAANESGLRRPTGEIDVLIGYRYAKLHPRRV